MTARQIVAAFDGAAAAQAARAQLIDLGIPSDRITLTDQSSLRERKLETPQARGSFWAHIKEMFMPDHDRHTYEESMRRGGCVLVATVNDSRADEAIACLERAGAVDLNERENQWRAQGWHPAVDTRDEVAEARAAQPEELDRTNARAKTSDEAATIPVVEERLSVGKREVNRGSVRVRSYVVEEPVHEDVRLREEHVNVERRPVNEPARPVVKGSPEDLLQERTIEVSETAEQAVIGKEARVTEQVVVSKDTKERVESIDDTVRRTKVEVEDGRNAGRPVEKSKTENPARNRPPPERT